MSVKTILSQQIQPTALQMMMKLPIPAFLLWGEDLCFYFNPAFNEHLGFGKKNAFPMGIPVGTAWPECKELLTPVVEGVRASSAGIRSALAFFPLLGVWEGRPVSWTYCFEGIVDEKGRPEGIFVTCMYQALIYDAIAASTPDLIYVFDLDYKFVYANKALLTMWGRSWEQSIGQGLRALGYESWHAEMHEREIDTVVATKQSIRGEVSFLHAVQGRRIYDYIFAPVLDENDEVIAIAGTTRDISELKAAEDALRKSEERLEQTVSERTSELQRSNEDLLQFAHVASHDLKEPTRKVRFFADRLFRDPDSRLSAEGKRYIEKINSAADRMFHMIDGVLNYSKVNNLQEAYSAVDLSGVIQQIVFDLEVLILQKEARVEVSYLPTIQGAPVLLYQLFYNLINNSLKFARKDVPAVIVIEAAPVSIEGREWWQISVRDNGIGFAQVYAEKIFSTFVRLHSKDLYEGTGLGLSLCRKIVERHGGTIVGNSNPGEGSVFRIKLPMDPV